MRSVFLDCPNYNLKDISKKVLPFFILLFLTACEGIHYDAEKRLVFQTVVLDSHNQPLPNTHVEISVSDGYPSGGGLISLGETDQEGKITLIFPYPDNYNSINLKIYNDDAAYMQKEISNINKSDFVNYKFVFTNAYLLKQDETAILNLNYSQSDANIIIKKVNINGIYHTFPDYYNSPEDDYYMSLPMQVYLKKNQAFQLKYTLFNMQTQAETEHTVDLQIGNDAMEYTINY